MNIGIDLGTTNTSVCFFSQEHNTYDYLHFDENTLNYFPSMITYRPDSDIPLIGFNARKKMHIKGSHYFLGREIKLQLGKNTFVRNHTVMDLLTDQLAAILNKFFEEKKVKPDHIVLTVPAKWMNKSGNGREIEMLRQVFHSLGFDKTDVSFESEPVAATAFFCHEVMKDSFSGYCLVVDYGGGTLDATLCRVAQNREIHVVYTTGVTGEAGLGCAGEAFDIEICHSIIHNNEIDIPASAKDENGNLNTSSKWFLKLMRSVEEGKITDTTKTTTGLTAYYSSDKSEKKRLFQKSAFEVTYDDVETYEVTIGDVVTAFEKVNLPSLKELLEDIRKFCKDSDIELNPNSFCIIPTGGFSGLFCMDETIRHVFNSDYQRKEIALLDRNARSTAIAHGAAILADELLSVVPVCHADIGFFFYDAFSEEKKKITLIHKNESERTYKEAVFADLCFEAGLYDKTPILELFCESNSFFVPVNDLCPAAGNSQPEYRFGFAIEEGIPLLYSKDKNENTRVKSLEYILK